MSEFTHVDYTTASLEPRRLSVCNGCRMGIQSRRCHAGLSLLDEWERIHRCAAKTEPCGPPEEE